MEEKHVKIVVVSQSMNGGHWGIGNNVAEALTNMRKMGGSTEGHVIQGWRFSSHLPFAPRDREAHKKDEADVWVSAYGVLHWERCEREEIEI